MDIRRCAQHGCHYDMKNGCPFCSPRVFEGELTDCACASIGIDNADTPAVAGLLPYFTELERERSTRDFHGPKLRLRVTVEILG